MLDFQLFCKGDGYLFDENMNKIEFKGYRADCITDFALEFLEGYDGKTTGILMKAQWTPRSGFATFSFRKTLKF